MGGKEVENEINIAVIGLGLIGGSLCKSIKKYTKHHCWGMDTDTETIAKALAEGTIEGSIGANELRNMDLTIICLHPLATMEVILKHQEDFKPGAVVIDVCGIKKAIMDVALPALDAHGVYFVGTHPMAGREFSGYDYALAELYQGASFIITPAAHTPVEVIDNLKDLATELGFGKIVLTTPEIHDQTIAFTSQLAHVVSNGYIKSPTIKNESGFSAGSFLDLTRVAQLNATMWSELFMLNREALLFEIDNLIVHLQQYAQALQQGEVTRLQTLLQEGSHIKEESLKGV